MSVELAVNSSFLLNNKFRREFKVYYYYVTFPLFKMIAHSQIALFI